jgi:hypothetical protein
MTNYLIYTFADALQYSDNPTYTVGSAGSYTNNCAGTYFTLSDLTLPHRLLFFPVTSIGLKR